MSLTHACCPRAPESLRASRNNKRHATRNPSDDSLDMIDVEVPDWVTLIGRSARGSRSAPAAYSPSPTFFLSCFGE
jgi:hypothetical protein